MTRKIINNLVHSKCPICGDSDIKKSFDLNYSQNVIYSSTTIELSLNPELWDCSNCKSFFTQNATTEKDSIDLYKNSEASLRWTAKKFDQDKTIYTSKILKKYIKKDYLVLDIGCNSGEFLDFAKNNGAKTFGFEYSTNSIEICKSKGHNMLKSLSQNDFKFDVITAFDLVEHLYDTQAFFKSAYELLNENGKLIIFTGDIESWAFKNSKGRWWYLNYPEHIVFISSFFYKNILKTFRVKKIYKTYNNRYFKNLNFSTAALFNYSKMLGLRKGLKPYEGLPSPTPDHIIAVLEKK